MDSQGDELLVQVEDGLAVLTLNRPERLNALSRPLLQQLYAEVPRVCADPAVRAILLTGAGRAFCAGGDVGGMGPPDAQAVLGGMAGAHTWVKALRFCEKPVVCAVNGAAAGAASASP